MMASSLSTILSAAIRIGLLSNVLLSQKSAGLDNGLGLSPPMGWNSWNTFHCDITEKIVRDTADNIKALGLGELGYRYVNIDDCWMAFWRTQDGKLMGNSTTFPNGMKYVGDYLHGKGLLFGIYGSAGYTTCAKRAGSLDFEHVDAQTFADWGVDYLKYDNCYHSDLPSHVDRFSRMRDALNATGRPIFYSISQGGREGSWRWVESVANAFRISTDIQPHWEFIQDNFWKYQEHVSSGQTGGRAWMDPDMLEVGNGDLTYEESQSHFSLWCLAKAPLLLGNDFSTVSNESLAILSNRELIRINQDVNMERATCYTGCSSDAKMSVFAASTTKHSNDGFVVMMAMNWSDEIMDGVTVSGQDVGVVPRGDEVVVVTDLWNHSAVVGTFTYQELKSLPLPRLLAHASVVYKFSRRRAAETNVKEGLVSYIV